MAYPAAVSVRMKTIVHGAAMLTMLESDPPSSGDEFDELMKIRFEEKKAPGDSVLQN